MSQPASLSPPWESVIALTLLAVAACGGRANRVASSGGNSGTTSGLEASTASGASAIGVSGTVNGSLSGSIATGSGVAESGATPRSPCPATLYPDGDGGCACAGNAYRSVTITLPDGDAQTAFSPDGGTCACDYTDNAVCTDDAGAAQCVNTNTDSAHCGGCEMSCTSAAVCNSGACSAAPTQLVAPTPGCLSIHLAYEGGAIYWADLGHGTLQSVPASGGSPTTIASGLHLAAIQQPANATNVYDYQVYTALPFPGTQAVGAGILVQSGTVYWIAAADTVRLVEQSGQPMVCDGDGACIPSGPPQSLPYWIGGVGSSIVSVTPGGTPTVVLPTELIPAASPASVTNNIEVSATTPPILAIALSPDGQTLYFGAGSRVYSIPSIGAHSAADVTYVGYASPLGSPGSEAGWANALTADSRYAYLQSGWWDDSPLEFLSSPDMCSADAGPECPKILWYATGGAIPDTIGLRGNLIYWGNQASGDVEWVATSPGSEGGVPLSLGRFTPLAMGEALTGFAIGPTHAYFGEDGYVEKGAPSSNDPAAPANTAVLARGQPLPTSFTLDGTNVYWTTSRCDIMKLADSPQ